MRKIPLILSLFLAIIFGTGHYFIYKMVLNSHKTGFKQYIRSNYARIEILEIDPSELYCNTETITWHDENTEISRNGTMYDILHIAFSGTKVKLFVVNDQNEKELMNHYKDQFNDSYGNTASGKKSNNLIKHLIALKYLLTDRFLFLNPNPENSTYQPIATSITEDLNDPVYSPPEFI